MSCQLPSCLLRRYSLRLHDTPMFTKEIFILLSEPEVLLCFYRDITLSGFLSVSIGT